MTDSGKIWAEIPGTCKFVDEEECKNIEKTRKKYITEKVCTEIPKKKCREVEEELCTTRMTQKCGQECSTVPKQECEIKHRKIPISVSKTEPHIVCEYIEEFPEPPRKPKDVV